MKGIFAAIWRFSIDDCEGGRRFTALAIKGCALVLLACLYAAYELAPKAVEVWRQYQAAMSSVNESVVELKHVLELQGVRYSARDDGQDYRIGRLQIDVDEAERDIAQAQREIVGLRGDVRRLDEVTVKVGRP